MTSPGRFPARSSGFRCAELTGQHLARGIETLLHPLHVRSTACEQREGVNSLEYSHTRAGRAEDCSWCPR
jgi:hypothetical protein